MEAVTKVVKRLIPEPCKQMVRNYRETRERTRLFGDLAPLVPKVKDMFDGPQGLEVFKANGEEFLGIYKDICGLRPDEKMLDVGSGIGRKTIPLTRYFNDRAVYEGLDIVSLGVDWCREHITPRFSNFHFQWIDVYNKHYNPTGKWQPADYKFPFPSESFSFVMLGSVFTHMPPKEVENYLSEVCRVLKKGERCMITYLLLNEESLRNIEQGRSTLALTHVFDGYRAISKEMPEWAIGLDDKWVRDLYKRVGLNITRLDYGSWCGRKPTISYQDMVLAVKA